MSSFWNVLPLKGSWRSYGQQNKLQFYIIIEAYVNVCWIAESWPMWHFPLQLVSSLSLSIQLWYYITDYWPVLKRTFCLDVIPITELIVIANHCLFIDFCQKNPVHHKAPFLRWFSANKLCIMCLWKHIEVQFTNQHKQDSGRGRRKAIHFGNCRYY